MMITVPIGLMMACWMMTVCGVSSAAGGVICTCANTIKVRVIGRRSAVPWRYSRTFTSPKGRGWRLPIVSNMRQTFAYHCPRARPVSARWREPRTLKCWAASSMPRQWWHGVPSATSRVRPVMRCAKSGTATNSPKPSSRLHVAVLTISAMCGILMKTWLECHNSSNTTIRRYDYGIHQASKAL